MYCKENCMTHLEDEAGCWDVVKLKLHKKRPFIMITLLLISAIVSIIAGMYNGLTLKKYSDMAILVGIFFPSIILVLVCVYLAYVCGRESFRSSALSQISPVSGHCRNSQDALECPQTNSETRSNQRVSCRPKAVAKFINNPMTTAVVKSLYDEKCYVKDDTIEYCDSKISRKHFKSFSNSDISKQMHKRHDVFYKKTETCKADYITSDDIQYSARFREHKDINQPKKFKRSVSDTANKNKYARSREDEFIWNTQSLNKLRRHMDKRNCGQTDCESSYEIIKKSSSARKNYKNTEECDTATRFQEYSGYDQKYKGRQKEYGNANPCEGLKKKSCYSKSEIHLCSSSVLKAPCEYKQTVHFSTFQPRANDIKDTKEITSYSSRRNERNSSFSRNCTIDMARKNQELENFALEQDAYHLRKKPIHFVSVNCTESALPSGEYAHEYCGHSKKENKIVQDPYLRSKRCFEEEQSDIQERFHWRRMSAIESKEESV